MVYIHHRLLGWARQALPPASPREPQHTHPSLFKTLSASLWPFTVVFKTMSGKTKPYFALLLPFYFSSNA